MFAPQFIAHIVRILGHKIPECRLDASMSHQQLKSGRFDTAGPAVSKRPVQVRISYRLVDGAYGGGDVSAEEFLRPPRELVAWFDAADASTAKRREDRDDRSSS
jgi:hypothetical protein